MKTKKAFEIQFNWLFVLVVGAAILVFFAAIAIKQKDLSKASIDVTILKGIQSIVSSAAISTGTTQIKEVPDSNIEIGCNEISVGKSSKKYENIVVFAPGLIKGEKIITKTMDFSLPFKITNFLFLTSPNVRYVVISDGNDELANQVYKSLPTELSKEFYDHILILNDENNYKVRFVFFRDFDSSFLEAFEGMPDHDVTALKVTGNPETGVVEFYEKVEAGWESKRQSSYIGLSSLIGAIYSDKVENYECNIGNAFETLDLVYQVYISRTSKLESSISASDGFIECSLIYEAANEYLSEIMSYSSNFNEYTDELINAANRLSNKNQEAQFNSCSLIY